jgi:hypothetical protein
MALGDTARAFLLLLISGVAALAQRSSIEVHSPSAKLLDTAPGRIVTASVVVANRGSQADQIAERLTLPPGCQKIAPPDLPFWVETGGQIVRVLAVLVPANMPAGRFEMHYAAQSRRDPSSSGSVDLAIQVTPVDNLELIVEQRPDMVFAGDTYPVKLRVTNHGNSRISVQLTHRSSLGFAVNADAAAFALEAGASREIVCSVKVDPAFAQHIRHAVTFDVTATSASGKTLTASQASVVEIIPRISGSRDPFHYLPMQVRLMTLAETDHVPQFQMEISGAGSLDEAGKHRARRIRCELSRRALGCGPRRPRLFAVSAHREAQPGARRGREVARRDDGRRCLLHEFALSPAQHGGTRRLRPAGTHPRLQPAGQRPAQVRR